jgi:aryl-alcohol dehydrogenase-like predicted oxidoreductase
MEYRTLGNTELKISAITFGAWAIGGWRWGGTDEKAAVEAIHAGLDEGMSTIDTAPIYGYGLSEQLIGKALKCRRREDIQLFTKFGLRWDLPKGELYFKDTEAKGKVIEVYKYAGKQSVIAECEQSLKRLNTDYIDLFQIHWPDTVTPIEETMEALVILKQQGKIREAGVCNYTTAQMDTAEQIIPLASNQIPYSMLLRSAEEDVIPYCLSRQNGILAYSSMQRGVLTGKFSPDHQFKDGDHRSGRRFYRPENIKRINAFLEKIKPIADDHGAAVSQLVLRWTIDQPGITVALAGARNSAQAVQNARASALKLSGEEMQQINAALAQLELVA